MRCAVSEIHRPGRGFLTLVATTATICMIVAGCSTTATIEENSAQTATPDPSPVAPEPTVEFFELDATPEPPTTPEVQGDPTASPIGTERPDDVVPAELENYTIAFQPVLETNRTEEAGADCVADLYTPEICYMLDEYPPLDGRGIDSATAVSLDAVNWTVTLVMSVDGIDDFNSLANECFRLTAVCPTGQIAIRLKNGLANPVLSAPTVQAEEFERDQITISGQFTEADANALAETINKQAEQ